jgi:HD superfamily phosphohydrolase
MLEEVKVIDNKICYPKQTYLHLCNLFTTRYYLHKQIYNHKTVKSIEYMLLDIIKILDPILGIKDSIYDLDKFILLTDKFLINYLDLMELTKMNTSDEIVKAQNILTKIKTRELYKFVGGYTITKTNTKILNFTDFKNIIPDLKENDIIISYVNIGYISGQKDNPLDNIYLYDKKNDTKCFKIKKEDITNLLPDMYQETCVKVYCISLEQYKDIHNAFNKLIK